MSLEHAMYERDWAVCADCDCRRPILQLRWEFRPPAPLAEVTRNGVPQFLLAEGPAAPFRVCIDRVWCQAQQARAIEARVRRVEPNLLGWVWQAKYVKPATGAVHGRRPRPGRRWRR